MLQFPRPEMYSVYCILYTMYSVYCIQCILYTVSVYSVNCICTVCKRGASTLNPRTFIYILTLSENLLSYIPVQKFYLATLA